MSETPGKKPGGWLMGALRASTAAVSDSWSSSVKRVKSVTSNYSARGNTARTLPIDESAQDWRVRSGREGGPETYVHGDLCRAVFRRALALSPREREVLYGGAVLLLGVMEAQCVGAPDRPPPDTYVSITLEDGEGESVREEHQLTRTVPASRAPQWDEVVAVGQKVAHLQQDVKRLKITIKRYGGGLLGGGSEKLGSIRLSIADLMAQTDVDKLLERGQYTGESGGGTGWVDRWLTLTGGGACLAGSGGVDGSEGGGGGGATRIRVFMLFHRPPTLPSPSSIGVWATAGYSLGGGVSGSGSGGPSGGSYYVTVALVNRLGERVRDTENKNMRALRGATVKDVSVFTLFYSLLLLLLLLAVEWTAIAAACLYAQLLLLFSPPFCLTPPPNPHPTPFLLLRATTPPSRTCLSCMTATPLVLGPLTL